MLQQDQLPPPVLSSSDPAPHAILGTGRWTGERLPPINAPPSLPSLGKGWDRRDPAPGPEAVTGASQGLGGALPVQPGSAARGQIWPHPPATGKPRDGYRRRRLELKAFRARVAKHQQDMEVLVSCAWQREEQLLAQVEELKTQVFFLLLARKQDEALHACPTEPPMDVEEKAEEGWPALDG